MKKGLILVAAATLGLFCLAACSAEAEQLKIHRMIIEDHCGGGSNFDQQIILSNLDLLHNYQKNLKMCNGEVTLIISPKIDNNEKIEGVYFVSLTRHKNGKVLENISGSLSGKQTVIWVKPNKFQQVRRK